MKRWMLAVPFVVAFGTPWVHWLMFKNIHMAIPDADIGGAHFIAIVLSFFSVAAIMWCRDFL